MSELFWWLFASLAVGGAIGTVLSRSPVSSLLSLVLTFFSLAAIYILLGAHFIGAIQVMVYAGAIMVLFLFVIMLLNLGHDYKKDLRGGGWLLGASSVAGLGAYFAWRAVRGDGESVVAAGAELAAKAMPEGNAVGVVADPLFRQFLMPFELTSVLLLVAVVGAVLLAKRRV